MITQAAILSATARFNTVSPFARRRGSDLTCSVALWRQTRSTLTAQFKAVAYHKLFGQRSTNARPAG
jgi:hypothetical protein